MNNISMGGMDNLKVLKIFSGGDKDPPRKDWRKIPETCRGSCGQDSG